MSRKTSYTRELSDEICRRVADGETLPNICRDAHIPARTTINQWIMDKRDGFHIRYAEAKTRQLELIAEEMLDIADDGRNDWMRSRDPENNGYRFNGEHAQRSRLRIDTRKWLLVKLLPDKYGDRVAHTGVNGKDLIPDRAATDERIIDLLTKAGMTEDAARAALDADA